MKKKQKIVKISSKFVKPYRGVASDLLVSGRRTFNEPNTATELGRDPDMLHNVPMAD